MRNEILSSVGAQNMDTSGYQVTDLDDFEFYWENRQLVSVLRPGINASFSASTFNVFGTGSMTENPILNDDEQDKENSPPPTHSTTPVSVRPSQPPLLMRNRPIGTRNENIPNYVYRNLFG